MMIRKKITARIKRVIKVGGFREAPEKFDTLFPEVPETKQDEEKEQSENEQTSE